MGAFCWKGLSKDDSNISKVLFFNKYTFSDVKNSVLITSIDTELGQNI